MKIFVAIFTLCLLKAVVLAQNPNENACPQFQSKYEGDALVIDLSGSCKMVVGVLDLSSSLGFRFVSHLSHFGRNSMHIPTVTYRQSQSESPVTNTEEKTMCPPFPVRYLGTRVVVDTEIGRCQMVLGVRTFRAMPVNRSLFPRFMGSMMVTRAVFETPNRLL